MVGLTRIDWVSLIGLAFSGGAFDVESEEAGEDFVTDGIGPSVAIGLLLAAPSGLIYFIVQ